MPVLSLIIEIGKVNTAIVPNIKITIEILLKFLLIFFDEIEFVDIFIMY